MKRNILSALWVMSGIALFCITCQWIRHGDDAKVKDIVIYPPSCCAVFQQPAQLPVLVTFEEAPPKDEEHHLPDFCKRYVGDYYWNGALRTKDYAIAEITFLNENQFEFQLFPEGPETGGADEDIIPLIFSWPQEVRSFSFEVMSRDAWPVTGKQTIYHVTIERGDDGPTVKYKQINNGLARTGQGFPKNETHELPDISKRYVGHYYWNGALQTKDYAIAEITLLDENQFRFQLFPDAPRENNAEYVKEHLFSWPTGKSSVSFEVMSHEAWSVTGQHTTYHVTIERGGDGPTVKYKQINNGLARTGQGFPVPSLPAHIMVWREKKMNSVI